MDAISKFCTAAITIMIMHPASVKAQERTFPTKFETSGLLIGFGSSCPNYQSYKVHYIAWDYSSSFRKPQKNDFVSFYLEPQFNFTTTGYRHNYELGANTGIRNYIKINRGFYFYQMLGSGPHFISAKLKSQASGFIFSDNLFLGTMSRIREKYFLNLQFGMRHISNASMKKPNHGMNTFNFRLGISRIRQRALSDCHERKKSASIH